MAISLHAGRRLTRSPWFALFAIAILALGIGATTAVFSVVRAVTGPPPGVPNAERIVNVYNARVSGSRASSGVSWPDFQDFRAQQTSFAVLTASSSFGAAVVGATGSTTVMGEVVEGQYFIALGVLPELGRLLQPADDRPDAPEVAVISYSLWQRLYAGSRDVVGQLLRINGTSFEVIGVAPDDFRGLFNNGLTPAGVWVPTAAVRALEGPGQSFTLDNNARGRRWLMVRGLLDGGVTLDRAAAELAEIAGRLDAAHPLTDRQGRVERRDWFPRRMTDVGLDADRQIVDPLIAMLMLAVIAVLAVACTNVGNMILARGSARAHDVAIRASLGASRGRLIVESLLETTLLAFVGGAAGIGVAKVIVTAIAQELAIPGTPATLWLEPRLDARALAAAFAAVLVAVGVAGVIPAILSTRPRLQALLASESAATAPRWRGRRYLIVAQVTASVMLLSLAALAARELRAQLRHDPGFDVDRLAVTRIRFDSQGYDDARAKQILESARVALARRPEVAGVAIASHLQAVTGTGRTGVRLPGESRAQAIRTIAATPDVFETIGVTLLHGRPWPDARPEGAAVISERMARDLFGVSDAVGRTVFAGLGERAEPLTVVGVAADTDVNFYGYSSPHGPLMYVPIGREPVTTALLIARTHDEDAEHLVPILRQALVAVDPALAVDIVDTARRLAGATTLFYSIVAVVAAMLGSFAWVLALGGLSGILAHVVHRRTREIGLRVALGARREQILRMVIREGLTPVAVGVIGGLAVGAAARSLLQAEVEQLLPATDVAVFLLVPALFLGAAVVACYLPARRAASVDPIVALREL